MSSPIKRVTASYESNAKRIHEARIEVQELCKRFHIPQPLEEQLIFTAIKYGKEGVLLTANIILTFRETNPYGE